MVIPREYEQKNQHKRAKIIFSSYSPDKGRIIYSTQEFFGGDELQVDKIKNFPKALMQSKIFPNLYFYCICIYTYDSRGSIFKNCLAGRVSEAA